MTELTPAQQAEATAAESQAFNAAIAAEDPPKSFEAPPAQPIHQAAETITNDPPATLVEPPAPEPEYTPDPKLEALIQSRIEAREKALREDYHRVESKFGRMEKQLQEALSRAAVPANANVRKALDSLPEFKEIQSDNPEYAKVFEALAANIAAPDVSGMLATMQDKLRAEYQAELVKLRLETKHEGWEQTAKSPEFIEFVYTDGPTPQERNGLESIGKLMDEATKKGDVATANAYQNQWQARLNEQIRSHPLWWANTGAAYYSDKVEDSITLLDKFKNRAAEEPRDKTPDKRLQRDVEPTKGNRPPAKPKPQTEREAMEAAFYS